MKRPFSFLCSSSLPLLAAGTGLIAATYGLVRLAYGLFLPDVQGDLALSVASAGVISGGASVVYCAGALIGFFVAARHARALVIAAALSAAIGAIGMATADSATHFAVFAIAGSAGAGLASPALVAVLQRNPSTQGRTRAQAIVNAGSGPGLVSAGVLALILLPDWRLAWMIAAVFTIAVAGVILVVDQGSSGIALARRSLPPASWFAAHRSVLLAALMMGFGSAAMWTYGRTFLIASGADQTLSVLAWIALGRWGNCGHCHGGLDGWTRATRCLGRHCLRRCGDLRVADLRLDQRTLRAGRLRSVRLGVHRRHRNTHLLDGSDRPSPGSRGYRIAFRHLRARAGYRRKHDGDRRCGRRLPRGVSRRIGSVRCCRCSGFDTHRAQEIARRRMIIWTASHRWQAWLA